MIKRVIVVALAGVMLAGCSNTSTLSGDTYSASEAKQVQSVFVRYLSLSTSGENPGRR
ncbi:Outer membrane lipoprotein slyB precursor [Pantoea agglomerans]|uniref:Outer membrane lipoprotein slyB n=1 Tax=Enterobacter agglomerans TaxID=549 RepID=A0A379AHK6_ENTAG|nr:Outer membrane lipoprotein slyB precursor [Pantoea agglomerans]